MVIRRARVEWRVYKSSKSNCHSVQHGPSQAILSRGRGRGGEVTLCQSEGTHHFVMLTFIPAIGLKAYSRGGSRVPRLPS